jgi:hypothetical protein
MTMSRLLFLLLVLANVAFFVYARLAGAPGTRDSGAPARQMEADKVRVLTPEQATARIRAVGGTAPSASAAVSPGLPERGCFEWGAFAPADLAAARAAADQLARGVELTERRVGPPTGWWVYVPPLENRAAANARIAEIRSQGIDDVSLVVEDPKFANGVSLGVFASAEAAAKRLAEVRRRGVKAEAGPREASSQRIFLRFADAPGELRSRFAEQRAAFPAADVSDCPKT